MVMCWFDVIAVEKGLSDEWQIDILGIGRVSLGYR